jgi:hypothetical protein
MKKLIICGKGNDHIPLNEIAEEDAEIWLHGTDTRDGADWYFELHGIDTGRENIIYEIPETVYRAGLPINNTICAMLVCAWLSGYQEIRLCGAPLEAKSEYQEEKPAVAFIVGFLKGKGIKITWDEGPQDKGYGRKHDTSL